MTVRIVHIFSFFDCLFSLEKRREERKEQKESRKVKVKPEFFNVIEKFWLGNFLNLQWRLA